MGADLKRETREITSLGEWLRWRQAVLTASPIGALFDQHPHITLADLVAEKRGERRGEGDNPSMRAGRLLEPAVIAAINEERPELRVKKATTFHLLPELRLGCTPDAFGEDGELLVQCKTASREQWDKWHGTPPVHYLLQTLTEMLVTGCERGILAVLLRTPSYPLHTFEVKRHPAAERRMLDAVAEFWRKWDAGEHPEPQSAEGLAQLYDDGSTLDLSNDNEIRELLDAREMANAGVKAREERLKEIDAAIKEKLGDAAKGWLPGWSLSYGVHHRKETLIPAKAIRTLRVRRTRAEQEEEEHAE